MAEAVLTGSLIRATALACGLVLTSHTVLAQSLPRKVLDDVRYTVGDALFVFTSPLYADGNDLATLAAVIAATGIAAVYDDELDAWVVDHPSTAPMKLIQPFRVGSSARLEKLGSGSLMIQASGVLYLAGLVVGSDDLRDAGIGCAAAEKSQAAVRHGVYKAVSRRRPIAADGDPYRFSVPGGDWFDHSFFGGHGANIMTCAGFLTRRFDLALVEPVLLGLAVGVGLARIADRMHWLSDAVVGGAFGYAMGKAFADRQLARRAARDDRQRTPAEVGLGGVYADYVRGSLVIGWRGPLPRSFLPGSLP